MELWIRNQDRENLVKVELLEINERENDYAILTIYENRTANLGLYKSKERALEILDEIEERIIELDKAVIYSHISEEDYLNVYEMPEE